jgi:membrane-bound ClpP family serine protease
LHRRIVKIRGPEFALGKNIMQLRKWAGALIIVSSGFLGVANSGTPLAGHTATRIVYLAPIEGTIDLGIAPFAQRVINEATSEGAAAVILEINTFGGRVDGAVIIRDALLSARVKTVAFVNRRAISAGALITLAAEIIAMSDGATLGAAAPVQIGQPGGPAQPVEEKTLSYVRAAGIAEIDGERIDVISDGEFINPGENIVVTRVDGNRIVVRHQRTTERRQT